MENVKKIVDWDMQGSNGKFLIAHSRTMIEKGSKSFAIATKLFAPEMRDHATLLYAWCRYCDDVIDGQALGEGPLRTDLASAGYQLAHLRQETERALSKTSLEHPIFAGLQAVVVRYDIPARYPRELLDGFGMDVAGRIYETIDDTLDYAYHVAGVVGVMMAYVMGVRDKQRLQRAADLGIALQLTNIARDVLEDAKGHRLYLPRLWLREVGIPEDPAFFEAYPEPVFAVVERLLLTAEAYYRSAAWGLVGLGFRSAWAVAAAGHIYRDIGNAIRRRGPKGLKSRTTSSANRRLWRALESLGFALRANTIDRLLTIPDRPKDLWTKI